MGLQQLLLLLLLDGHDFDRHELLVGRRSERARLQIVLAAEKDTPRCATPKLPTVSFAQTAESGDQLVDLVSGKKFLPFVTLEICSTPARRLWIVELFYERRKLFMAFTRSIQLPHQLTFLRNFFKLSRGQQCQGCE